MKIRVHIQFLYFAIALVAISCGNNGNKQGGKYTYSYITYGTKDYKDIVFESANDTLAYIWAQEKFISDQKAVYAELNMSDMDKWTSFRIPKEFIVKKGNRAIEFDNVKSPVLMDEESIAYNGARFGMTRDEVKALPEFAEWIPKSREDAYYGDNGKKFQYPVDYLYYRTLIGDYAYDVTMDFDHDGKLKSILFNTDGSTIVDTVNEAREQFLFLIRSRYGMSIEDKKKSSFDNGKENYHWEIGDKQIALTTVAGSMWKDVNAYFYSKSIEDANVAFYEAQNGNQSKKNVES